MKLTVDTPVTFTDAILPSQVTVISKIEGDKIYVQDNNNTDPDFTWSGKQLGLDPNRRYIQLEEHSITPLSSLTQDEANEQAINFIYFTQNYPAGWLPKCFDNEGTSMVNHLQSKFSDLYHRYGSIAVVTRFMMELTDDRKKSMFTWITKNYNYKG